MSKSDNKKALQPLKDQIANELNINLNDGPNLTTAQVGHVGGQMVKRMIDTYENSMKNISNNISNMQG
jgi:hypothetical protein